MSAVAIYKSGLENDLVLPAENVEPRWYADRKSTRLNSSHIQKSRMPSSA